MTSKFLNLSTDGTLAGNSDNTAVSEKAIKTYADNKVLCYGVSTTAAATVQKEVSIPSVTNLAVGTVIIIQPTITSTVANSTIKLNDFDAYPMRYNNAAITTSTDSVVWNVAYPSMWVFDGTYWVFVAHGVDSNSTYDMSYLNATGTFKAGGESGDTQVITRYCLVMQRPDRTWEKLTGLRETYSTGTAKTVNTHGFLLPADIRYYNTTTIIAAGGFAGSQTLRPFNGAIDMRYSTNCGNTPGWTNGEEFFLVGTIGSDGLFYLDSSTWWSNALPTSNDGKVYIQVGVVHGTYNVTLALRHPIYYHDGTQIREYQVADNKQDVITDLSTIRSNASSGAAAATTIAGYGDIVTHNASEFALDSNAVHKTGDESIAGTKTFTGKVVSPIVETGSAASNYFQCQKFRGQGDANTYYHAIDFGYQNHDQVDFYEYGGKWVFHKHTGSAQDSGDTVVGQILSTGWNGPVVGNVTGNLTGTASKATADANGNTISTTYTKKTDIMTGATSSSAGTAGLVPAPAVADKDKFLKGDGTWAEQQGGGTGPSRNIGEIVPSTIPLTDAGLHLLDGSVISSGSYAAFVSYIAGLVSGHPELFVTESEWQQSITDYGVCGKFVYDSVNNTVRLPLFSSQQRYLISSYKDGDTWYRIYSDGWCEQGGKITEIGSNTSYSGTFSKEFVDTNYSLNFSLQSSTGSQTNDEYGFIWVQSTDGFTAYQSNGGTWNSIWVAKGYIDISTYKVIPLYEYIVVANSTKTEIEVDIDQIAADLNGKVDKADLDEVQCVVETYSNGTSWYRVYSDGWCEQGGRTVSSSGYGFETITLLKPYNNVNYSLSVTNLSGGSRGDYRGGSIVSASTITVGYDSGKSAWETKGYLN